jgi:hypothetical protein
MLSQTLPDGNPNLFLDVLGLLIAQSYGIIPK